MAIRDIVKYPNAALKVTCNTVQKIDAKTQSEIRDLINTLENAKNPEGAGLSAPQIGLTSRICVVRKYIKVEGAVDNISIKTYILINPEITKFSTDKELRWEGCLSIVDKYVQVSRSKKIRLDYLDENGVKQSLNASGFFARVIQHEVDHLDGILMLDRATGTILTEKELEALHEEY